MTDQSEKATETETQEEAVEEAPSIREALEKAWADGETEQDTAEETAEETPPEEAPAEAVETPEEIAPPEWWGDDVEVWKGLPPEVQETLEKREKVRQEAIDQGRVAPEVQQQIDQIAEYAKGYGLTADQALGRLYQAQRMLDTNAKYGFLQLAQQYGIDLSELAAMADKPSGQTQQDIDPIQAVGQIVDARMSQYEQRQAEAQTQANLNKLQTWAEERDATGNPLRPHFYELQHLVQPEFGRLQSANPNVDPWQALQEAYDNVARVKAQPVPDVDALAEKKAQEKLEAMQQEAKKAQAAAVSPASTPSGVAVDTDGEPKTVREAVERAWALGEAGSVARI